jgi:hypothetical protein
MSKYEAWYDSLSPSTKAYLSKQAVWHDSDMWRAGLFGAVIGFLIGVIL